MAEIHSGNRYCKGLSLYVRWDIIRLFCGCHTAVPLGMAVQYTFVLEGNMQLLGCSLGIGQEVLKKTSKQLPRHFQGIWPEPPRQDGKEGKVLEIKMKDFWMPGEPGQLASDSIP